MLHLYDELPMQVEHNGQTYDILPYFNRILYCSDIISDDQYSANEKVNICFETLVKKPKSANFFDKQSVVNKIFKTLFEEPKNKGNKKKSFDFMQDSKYIYAGFMQCYGIDLFECKNKLHWWKFNALFLGLSKDTKIMEIIEIRMRPIPKRTKYNSEYIANLMKLKAEYQLQLSQEEREKEIQDFLGGLFSKLKNMAERK